MALAAWLTFWVGNVTAGFEMAAEGASLMGISGDIYFGFSVRVFLLSFFLFTPFNKYSRPTVKWTVARIIACLLVLMQTLAMNISPLFFLRHTDWSRETIVGTFLVMTDVMMVVSVIAVYAVLTIDRVGVRRERRARAAAKAAAEARMAEEAEAAATENPPDNAF